MTASSFIPAFDSLKADSYRGTFYLKDIYTSGVRALRRQNDLALPTKGTWEILDAYMAAADAIDPATGKPNFDKLLWEALARLYVNAGDITLAAIEVGVIAHDEEASFDSWNLFLDLQEQGMFPFLRVYKTEKTADEAGVFDFPAKRTGSMAKNELFSKMGGYTLAVHPQMARRTPGAIAYMLAQYFYEGGLLVGDSWLPQNTASGFARYYLTDGFEHYLIDFDGPMLARAMAAIDKACERTEDDGALILDEGLQAKDLSDDNPDLPT